MEDKDKKPFSVGEEWRTNELSKTPGGKTLIIQIDEARPMKYKHIKNTDAYLAKVRLMNPNSKISYEIINE